MPQFSANLLLTSCSFWWSPTSHNLYFPFSKGGVHSPASWGMDTEQEVGGPWQGQEGRPAGLWKRNPKPNWEGAGINLAPVTFNVTEIYRVSSTTHTFSSPQVALFCPASDGLFGVFFFTWAFLSRTSSCARRALLPYLTYLNFTSFTWVKRLFISTMQLLFSQITCKAQSELARR